MRLSYVHNLSMKSHGIIEIKACDGLLAYIIYIYIYTHRGRDSKTALASNLHACNAKIPS